MPTPILDQYDKLPPAERAGLIVGCLRGDPAPFFRELRQARPVLSVPGVGVFVSRYDDVTEVLTHQEAFGVGGYEGKMDEATGGFFLGWDQTADYDREASLLRLVADRADLPRVAEIVLSAAYRAMPAQGPLDVYKGIGNEIAVAIVEDYFGVTGIPHDQLVSRASALFLAIFASPDPHLGAAASMANDLNVWLDKLVAAKSADPDTLLGRLLALPVAERPPFIPHAIRRNLFGIVVGAVNTLSEAIANSLGVLLDRPNQLAAAVKAADESRFDDLEDIALEALRFNPQAPFITRRTTAPYVLGDDKAWSTTIPAGTKVYVGIASAMLDPDHVEKPEEFRAGRPRDAYLHFGYGPHACFGRFINPVAIARALVPLLLKPGLRRVAGSADVVVEWD